jgi:hypothetical protein
MFWRQLLIGWSNYRSQWVGSTSSMIIHRFSPVYFKGFHDYFSISFNGLFSSYISSALFLFFHSFYIATLQYHVDVLCDRNNSVNNPNLNYIKVVAVWKLITHIYKNTLHFRSSIPLFFERYHTFFIEKRPKKNLDHFHTRVYMSKHYVFIYDIQKTTHANSNAIVTYTAWFVHSVCVSHNMCIKNRL